MHSALELFSGIGGFAAAIAGMPQLTSGLQAKIAAVDIDRVALAVHELNFPGHCRIAAELASFDARALAADFWWLSPPCLPFTRKGLQRDDSDRRTRSLFHLIGQIDRHHETPLALAIENVPPFAESNTAAWVVEHLHAAGFETQWELRCPTELGWPVRRKRAYLLASRSGLRPLEPAVVQHRRLSDLLQHEAQTDAAQGMAVPQRWLEKYAKAIDLIDPANPDCEAACFTSSYGYSAIRSGSYIKQRDSVRFFTPDEILRCLGFLAGFRWPQSVPLRRRWALAGNSLSLPVVRWVLNRVFSV